MENFHKEHIEAINHFKTEARKAFAHICLNFGFKETDYSPEEYQNPFQIQFESPQIRILAEGIHWGMNANVCVGKNTSDTEWFNIEYICRLRIPTVPVTGSQTEQLYGYAHYLENYATDIMNGDTDFLDQLALKRKQEKEEAEKARQAAIEQKLMEGYVPIHNPYGDPILRKPRLNLHSYEIARLKFPQATPIYPESPLEPGYKAIIDRWFKDIGENIRETELLCELSTDKVMIEIRSATTGKLVWLLPEGTIAQSDQCIALIASDL
ncbi:lipoyl domain-containing protein [Xanthocytophaga agilis]|uniref:Lipoyl domain-containing protein n=1 Tax=Xanthocytophaga agilis TaxID=3048010 RepID=A0AAE3UDU0_9BACT|nr:lipoyl domain-containing protein [Xanthocytophaga agilis]MDJ1501570.1 lipoyl domain-containing protein [Xanthocytophaga agilis]